MRTRLDPEARREQLLALGTRMLSTRPLEEISIDLLAEEAGISRGLLYHYFGSKTAFHEAVVKRAVQDLYRITAPREAPDPLTQITLSIGAYVDYVRDNYAGYVSLVRAAAGGNERLRAIYLDGRKALTDRIFAAAGEQGLAALGFTPTPATPVLVTGWAAMVEDVVVRWVDDPGGVEREEVLGRLVRALVALLGER